VRERARGFPFATSGDRETVRQTRECTLQSRAKLQFFILRSAKCKGKCRLFKKKKGKCLQIGMQIRSCDVWYGEL